VARGRNRPPRLEPRPVLPGPAAPPPTPEERLARARVAGPRSGIGPTELRRIVERIVGGDRSARGELAALPGLSLVDAWAAITDVFGAAPAAPFISPDCTTAGARRAGERIAAVAQAGGRIAFAVASPATILPVMLAAADLARMLGGDVPNLPDVRSIRADGRTGRSVRWISGVAAVADGRSLVGTSDGEAAREWLFVLPRPSLVVAEPPFAEIAWEAGLEVVAFAGLERAALAIAAARHDRCTVVPMRLDREPAAYETVISCLREGATARV
jgi:hypothetical protein